MIGQTGSPNPADCCAMPSGAIHPRRDGGTSRGDGKGPGRLVARAGPVAGAVRTVWPHPCAETGWRARLQRPVKAAVPQGVGIGRARDRQLVPALELADRAAVSGATRSTAGRPSHSPSSRCPLTSPPEKPNLHMLGARRPGLSTAFATRPVFSSDRATARWADSATGSRPKRRARSLWPWRVPPA